MEETIDNGKKKVFFVQNCLILSQDTNGFHSCFLFSFTKHSWKMFNKKKRSEKKTFVSFHPILIFSHCQVCLSDPWVFTLKKTKT